jgi:hypothetical protein
MKNLKLILVCALMVSCSSFAPLADEERTQVNIVETGINKDDSYKNLVAYIAVNIGDSNHAIKVKDPSVPRVIFHFSDKCGSTNPLYSIDYEYSIKVDFKDNKARVSSTINSLKDNNNDSVPLYQANAEKYKKCHQGVVSFVKKAVAKKTEDKW